MKILHTGLGLIAAIAIVAFSIPPAAAAVINTEFQESVSVGSVTGEHALFGTVPTNLARGACVHEVSYGGESPAYRLRQGLPAKGSRSIATGPGADMDANYVRVKLRC